jgi:CDGSH-type Zn-finger protein
MRHVIHTATGPYVLTPEDMDPSHGDIAVCRCGLSPAFPFCDGSHRVTGDEAPDTVYRYPDGPVGERRVVTELRVDTPDPERDRDGEPAAEQADSGRIVTHEATSPAIIDPSDLEAAGGRIEVCQCGLSDDGVHCDGSHTACADERPGETYHYDCDGETERRIVDDVADRPVDDGG